MLCLRNQGYEVSLEPRKIYEVLPDRDAAAHSQLRVIDESGEDYLYPASLFASIALPQSVRRAVPAAGKRTLQLTSTFRMRLRRNGDRVLAAELRR